MRHYEGMFMVTFRNAATDRNMTKPRLMPAIPDKGESVEIRQKGDSWRFQQGTVTSRQWYIVDEDPEASEVIVMVSIEKSK